MEPVQDKTYRVFDWLLLAGNAGIAVIYIGLYLLKSLDTIHLGVSLYTTIIGAAHLLYLLTLYRYLRLRAVMGASLIGALLFTSNLAILILATGGFGSPYYALWLLLILAIGIYRPSVPLSLLALSTLYFVGFILSHGVIEPQVMTASIVALGATYVTGAVGFWLWHTQHTRHRGLENVSALTEQLTQEQIKAEVLLNHIGEGVVVVDHQCRITLLNPAGAIITGWSASEAKGLEYRLVMPLSNEQAQPLGQTDDIFTRTIQHKAAVSRDDLLLRTRSNKTISISLTVSPILDSDNVATGAIAVFRDISQAKLAERQRNEFISTASHEMRTPVAAVEGYIALAMNPKVAQIDDNARKYLQKAQSSTQHLGKLFQDLLAITRIEEGKLPNRPEVIDVAQLAGQVIDELRFKAQKKNLRLIFSAEAQKSATKNLRPLYYIYADPERIREVLTNLVDNAIKFTPQGSVEITLEGDDKRVTVGVKDSGVGIAPEDVPHLFQKFYRIGNQATANIGGTGLGLYISRAIIELYQGRIWVETAPNRGSHFKFSLDRLSYAQAQELAKRAPQPAADTTTATTQVPATDRPEFKRNNFSVDSTPKLQVE